MDVRYQGTTETGKAIKFPVNPVVGKYYVVPCVKNMCGEFIPINSYLHEDKKIIGFPESHWHIDWRFIPEGPYRDITTHEHRPPSKRQAESVITVYNSMQPARYSSETVEIHYKRMLCKREYGVSLFFAHHPQYLTMGWPVRLQKKFSCSSLKEIEGQLICPHKGIAIDKNCKDAEGNYVCPGHLLRFDPGTLKAVQ